MSIADTFESFLSDHNNQDRALKAGRALMAGFGNGYRAKIVDGLISRVVYDFEKERITISLSENGGTITITRYEMTGRIPLPEGGEIQGPVTALTFL